MHTWISRDPIGERGDRNLYLFCRNASVHNTDPLGDIIHAECLDKWLDQYATYEKRKTGSFDYFNGKRKGDGIKALIVERLLNSKYTFIPKKPAEGKNAEAHVATRVKIVSTASRTSQSFPKSLGCFDAANWVYQIAKVEEPRLDRSEPDYDNLIPGDWGYFDNADPAFDDLPTTGEHVIYLGTMGDKYFGQHYMFMTKDEWMTHIRIDWGGRPALGSPSGRGVGVFFPANGLQTQ